MTAVRRAAIPVDDLSEDELAAALAAGAEAYGWEYQAAVWLIVKQRDWLGRWEFRGAVEVDVDEHGRRVAWVDWVKVELMSPASAGQLRILELGRSLAGVANTRPLGELVYGLGSNLNLVLAAVSIAGAGRLA